MGEDDLSAAEVVVWKGEHRNDALGRMRWINSSLRVKDCYIIGEPGRWEIVIAAEEV